MKTKTIAILGAAFALTLGSVSAITVNVARGTGNPGIIAAESNGTQLTAGGYYFGLGTFSSSGADAPPTITDYASLVTAVSTFKEFKFVATPTSGATQGLLAGSFAGTTPNEGTAADFNLLEMYFVVGNKATLALSDQFGIFKLSAGTPDFPASMSASTVVSVTLSDVVSITPLTNAGTTTDTAGTGVFTLVAGVPEPSAALLGAVGVLGLLRRRRN